MSYEDIRQIEGTSKSTYFIIWMGYKLPLHKDQNGYVLNSLEDGVEAHLGKQEVTQRIKELQRTYELVGGLELYKGQYMEYKRG